MTLLESPSPEILLQHQGVANLTNQIAENRQPSVDFRLSCFWFLRGKGSLEARGQQVSATLAHSVLRPSPLRSLPTQSRQDRPLLCWAVVRTTNVSPS